MITYGKTFGGGMPIGILCGPRRLMNRIDPLKPGRVAYIVGTFSASPLTLACQNRFLKWVLSEEASKEYDRLRRDVAVWRDETNEELKQAFGGKAPISVQSYSSVWTIMYQNPSRYNFLLQYYMRDEGANLSWVGTGRVCFSLDFQKKDFDAIKKILIESCKRMERDGWWQKGNEGGGGGDIKKSLGKEILKAMITILFN